MGICHHVFFSGGYGRHRHFRGGFRTGGYGRHRRQWVKELCSTRLDDQVPAVVPHEHRIRIIPRKRKRNQNLVEATTIFIVKVHASV